MYQRIKSESFKQKYMHYFEYLTLNNNINISSIYLTRKSITFILISRLTVYNGFLPWSTSVLAINILSTYRPYIIRRGVFDNLLAVNLQVSKSHVAFNLYIRKHMNLLVCQSQLNIYLSHKTYYRSIDIYNYIFEQV